MNSKSLLIENKLSFLPIICKFGSEKTIMNSVKNNDVNIIQIAEEESLIKKRKEIFSNFSKVVNSI